MFKNRNLRVAVRGKYDGYPVTEKEDIEMLSVVPKTEACENVSDLVVEGVDASPQCTYLALDAIELDESYSARADRDAYTIGRYREALEAGDAFPPLVVCYVNGKWVLVDGISRFLVYQELYEGTRQIPCTVVRIPQDEAPVFYSWKYNYRNGRQLGKADCRKVARLLYLANKGAKIKDLAEKICIHSKTFSRYVEDLRDGFEKEKAAQVMELKRSRLTARQISDRIKDKYPAAKGLSRSRINEAKNKRTRKPVAVQSPENANSLGQANGSADMWSTGGRGNLVKARKFGQKSVEPLVIVGGRFGNLTIRYMEFFSQSAREELVAAIRQLVHDKITAKYTEASQSGKQRVNKSVESTLVAA